MMDRIYLDHAATTPLDGRVLEAMLPYLKEEYGNPSSIHRHGQKAEAAVETARETVAGILHCQPEEILFTSCGSESDNLALRGGAFAQRAERGASWILTNRTEHPAISRTAELLATHHGFHVEWLPVDDKGMLNPFTVTRSLCAETVILSVMYANNEVGTVNPITEIAGLCRGYKVPMHTDAVQAACYLDLNLNKLKVDMLSLGAHKFHGPKGVGVLYVRKGTPLQPQLSGGGQEAGLRAGTHNVPYIVGLAEALRLAVEERETRTAHVRPLRDRIIGSVLETIPEAQLTGHPEKRLPNHASFVFKEADGNRLLQLLDAEGFACSSGSACKTGSPKPSEVLLAMGLKPRWAMGSLRVSLGTQNTVEEVEKFLGALPGLVDKSRQKHG